MTYRSSLFTSVGCFLFIVSLIFDSASSDKNLLGVAGMDKTLQSTSDTASQCVKSANKATSSVGQQSGGMLQQAGSLSQGLTGKGGGNKDGIVGGASDTTSQCVKSASKATDLVGQQSGGMLQQADSLSQGLTGKGGGGGNNGGIVGGMSDATSQCVKSASKATDLVGQQSGGAVDMVSGLTKGLTGDSGSVEGNGGLLDGLLGGLTGSNKGGMVKGTSDATSQCVGTVNDASQQMTGMVGKQSSSVVDQADGLTKGLTGNSDGKSGDGGSLEGNDGCGGGNGGLVNKGGTVDNTLDSTSEETSQCVKTVKNTTGSMTDMTGQKSNCPLSDLTVMASLISKKCSKCKSADECMPLVCGSKCQQNCQISLLEICIQVILELRILGLLTKSMAPASGKDPLIKVLIKLSVALGINLPIKLS